MRQQRQWTIGSQNALYHRQVLYFIRFILYVKCREEKKLNWKTTSYTYRIFVCTTHSTKYQLHSEQSNEEGNTRSWKKTHTHTHPIDFCRYLLLKQSIHMHKNCECARARRRYILWEQRTDKTTKFNDKNIRYVCCFSCVAAASVCCCCIDAVFSAEVECMQMLCTGTDRWHCGATR